MKLALSIALVVSKLESQTAIAFHHFGRIRDVQTNHHGLFARLLESLNLRAHSRLAVLGPTHGEHLVGHALAGIRHLQHLRGDASVQ